MLSSSKPLAAEQARTYHKQQYVSKEENYWAKTAEVGAWRGQLAAELGLYGGITEEHFARMAEGQHPITGKQLIRHKASHVYRAKQGGAEERTTEHRAGWDGTINAPKSVSLVALVGGDDRVRTAHREAVDVALQHLEQYAYARMGGTRAPLHTGRLAIATFEHDVSRPVDGYAAPHLHTHSIYFNMTRDEAGKFRSLESKASFETQGFVTAVYQSELTLRLRKLGYEIERGEYGAPEIKGISREYIEASSPRSAIIREHMERNGFKGAEAAEIAAHATREAKREVTGDAARAAHDAIAKKYGNQAKQVIHEARLRADTQEKIAPEDRGHRAASAVTYAKNRNYEREAVTDERRLMRDALRHGMGILTVQDVQPEFEKRIASGEFQQWVSPKYASGRLFTTPQTIALEHTAVLESQKGKGTMVPLLNPEQASAFLASRPALNPSQRAAAQELLTSSDRVQGLQGFAGSGKSTTLAAIREAAEHKGYAVQGLAPSSRATANLAGIGVASMTLQRFLAQTQRESRQPDPERRRLILLDEASLSSTRQMRDLLQAAGPQDRVLVIGDKRQHQAVDAGKPFEQMRDAGMHVAQLNTIVRQKDDALHKAVVRLSNGDTQAGMRLLAAQNRVTEVKEKEARYKAIATAYAAKPEGTLIVSPDNASRRAINQEVRRMLQQQGVVRKEQKKFTTLIPRTEMTSADRKWATAYTSGDVLRYDRKSPSLGFEAGSYATVLSKDDLRNQLTVRTKDGRRATYDPDRLHGVTVYQPVQRSFAVGDRLQFTAPNRTLNVANRDLATILAMHGPIITARLDGEEKRVVRFDASQMPHLDHGYAVTSHSSQGLTAQRVLINMDTKSAAELVNQRFAYVSISRASHDAQVFTDDAARIGAKLGREVSKTSAVDFKKDGNERRPERELAFA